MILSQRHDAWDLKIADQRLYEATSVSLDVPHPNLLTGQNPGSILMGAAWGAAQ